jgi:hypothetical protein
VIPDSISVNPQILPFGEERIITISMDDEDDDGGDEQG